jgi:ABC-type antimicrobial peptide transport system permease subunit
LLAFGLTRAFSAAVEFTAAHQGSVLGTVIVTLCVTSLAAIAAPVLRASRADPVKALRE